MTAGSHFSVLGADGFIGSALARHLGDAGKRVDVYGRHDPIDLSRPLGHAIYCIGLTADYLDRPFDAVEAHVTLFARLLQDARFESLTYLSSTRLYDSGDGDGREEAPLVLDPHNPRHLYDFSKGLGEVLCGTTGRRNVRAARLACVYADDLGADCFLHNLVRDSLSSPRLAVRTRPDLARDYVHIEDACRALVAIATAGKRQIYNVASGRNVTNGELLDLVGRLTSCTISASEAASPGHLRNPKIDVTSLRRDFGLHPAAVHDVLPRIVKAHMLEDARR